MSKFTSIQQCYTEWCFYVLLLLCRVYIFSAVNIQYAFISAALSVFCVCFRCVSVCCAGVLCWALVHVHVHYSCELSVSAEEETVKRYDSRC